MPIVHRNPAAKKRGRADAKICTPIGRGAVTFKTPAGSDRADCFRLAQQAKSAFVKVPSFRREGQYSNVKY